MKKPPLVLLLALLGCQGSIGNLEGEDPTTRGPDGEPFPLAEVLCDPGETPMRRLTQVEYRRVVADLLGESELLAEIELPGDLKNDLVENAEGDQVRRRAVEVYAEAAEALVPSPMFADCSDTDCSRDAVLTFAERAFRRPLTSDQRSAVTSLFDDLDAEVGREDAERLAVVTLLQSPRFLYRLDISSDDDNEGWTALDDYDVASRLSFLFTGRGPDQALLDDAESGVLSNPSVRSAHVRRLLEDESNQRHVVSSFLRLWVDTEGTSVSYDGRLDDLFPAEIAEFMRHVAFVDDGTFADLLTSPHTYLNRELATHYQLAGAADLPENEMVRVEGDPERMVGMLSMGDIVARGAAQGHRSIHRGKFALRRLMCVSIPLPDQETLALIDELSAAEPPEPGQAHRDHIAELTGRADCRACHGLINPAGFAFENFDEGGRWQETDGEHRVDASGVLRVGSEELVFDDLRGFGEGLATSEAFRDCFIRDLFAFVYGRRATVDDGCLLEELQAVWDGGDGKVADLFSRLTELQLFSAQPTLSETESL